MTQSTIGSDFWGFRAWNWHVAMEHGTPAVLLIWSFELWWVLLTDLLMKVDWRHWRESPPWAPLWGRGPGLVEPLEASLRALTWPSSSRSCDWSALVNTGLWLVNTSHVTSILASDWSILVTWPGYWPLIGQYWSRDNKTKCSDSNLWWCFHLAVSQSYNTETHNEYVVLGNDAILKCNIPSFVGDFVSVTGWVTSEGTQLKSGYVNGKMGILGNFYKHTVVSSCS